MASAVRRVNSAHAKSSNCHGKRSSAGVRLDPTPASASLQGKIVRSCVERRRESVGSMESGTAHDAQLVRKR